MAYNGEPSVRALLSYAEFQIADIPRQWLVPQLSNRAQPQVAEVNPAFFASGPRRAWFSFAACGIIKRVPKKDVGPREQRLSVGTIESRASANPIFCM
jgi:hypothetical protein